nr:hypothetical protein [Tanacetum cinerariifolium]
MDDDDDDDDVWDGDDEWLMALVTPPGLLVATQPQIIDDLCIQMDNLEYRHGVLTRKIEKVSDAKVADSISIGEIQPRVATMEEQVQTL